MEKASVALNEALAKAADTASERLSATMDGVLSGMENHVMALAAAMVSAQEAISKQSAAQAGSAASMNRVAEAFSQTASNVKKASEPLLTSSERISGAVERMEGTIQAAVRALETEKSAASKLAETIGERMTDLQSLWDGYSERFKAIDGELGSALRLLSESTQEQTERVR